MIAVLISLSSCKQREKAELSEPQEKKMLEVGKAATDDLAKQLSNRLSAAVSEGGPVAGVRICSEVAQDLTAEVSGSHPIISVRRIGVRTRNKKNLPDEQDLKALEKLQSLITSPAEMPAPFLVADEKSKSDELIYRYYRPIPTAAQCVLCHGSKDAMPPDLRMVLDKIYPDDGATGFSMGELRGAFVVTIKADAK
jgi:hypothetical protein